MFATYLLNVSLEKTTKANNRLLFIAHALSFSLSLASLSHTRTLWGALVCTSAASSVCEWHSWASTSRFRFSIPGFLFCFTLLFISFNFLEQALQCVYFLLLSLLSLILFITILDLLLFIGNNILVCVCMVFMLLLVRSHVCPIFFIVFFPSWSLHIVCVCVSSV